MHELPALYSYVQLVGLYMIQYTQYKHVHFSGKKTVKESYQTLHQYDTAVSNSRYVKKKKKNKPIIRKKTKFKLIFFP